MPASRYRFNRQNARSAGVWGRRSRYRHEELVIAITEIGGSVIQSRGVVDNADTSALLVFNPSGPHAGWMGASCHWRYRSLYLEQSALDDLSRTRHRSYSLLHPQLDCRSRTGQQSACAASRARRRT
ncbi:AraC family ligand binding domain-containing protein [Bradyrhizobium sp. AZCC 1610]|uniref:AraC family ligand binding domain-containing protein n=1 Tax=Bradyrhizobium sp. AZCC 1610 TaxID=3117020 RepID=UPI003FA53830